MRVLWTVLALLLSVSLSAQSVSDTIIQRERAALSGGAHRSGFQCGVPPTSVTVNQRGRLGISCLGVHSRPPTIEVRSGRAAQGADVISLPRS